MLGEIKETKTENYTILEKRYLTKTQRLELNRETCIGCGVCETVCPKEAITLKDAIIINGRLVKKPEVVIEAYKCVLCGTCVVFCPSNSFRAITDSEDHVPVLEYEVVPILLKSIDVDSDKCDITCNLRCEDECPVDAISIETKQNSGSIQITNVHVNKRVCIYCKRCDAACPLNLITVEKSFEGALEIETGKCPKGCMACIDACPSNALRLGEDQKIEVDLEFCILCSACERVCPEKAIHVQRISVACTDVQSGTWSEILKKLTSTEFLMRKFEDYAEKRRLEAVIKIIP